MNACNETRLGVVMNYSVFLVDVMGRTAEAVKICTEAIEGAEKILASQNSMTFDEVRSQIDMVKENLTTWTGKDYSGPNIKV
jgi:hypothetical protein